MSKPHPASASNAANAADQGAWQEAYPAHSGAKPGAESGSGRWATQGPTVWTDEARNALATDFNSTLQRGVHGLCFSPYLEGQQPGSQIGEAQIRERLRILQPHARWVRSFSCTDGHEQTPRVAHELGLKTLVGAWLGTDAEINEREVQGVIEVARAGHADIVAVGNEVLLREDMSEDELLACIERVKDALPGVAVGYVDAYYLFE
jgi:exo-beta-1,3-glucanase (GH17 family)